jgi:hypothetical protein
VVGVGVAGIAPTLLGAAPGVSAVAPATAIASVSALGYVGSFSGPPVIGVVASVTSLPAALASLALGAGAIALFARPVLGDGPRTAR